jgi:NhaP-type Na+/H+ or K+/H+ antiporter
MHELASGSAALSFGVALAVGMAAQVIARHLQMPGIVLLLAAGVAVGPEGLGIVQPSKLAPAIPTIVNFAVAIILFEGGLNLRIRHLRSEARVIRRLITIGALVTAAGGTLAARLFMGWDWPLSILFGTLVIVTGPTVVTPLLRRLRVRPPASTILEAEGVLIDPIGAIIAVVALEFLYAREATTALDALTKTAGVLGGGALFGLIGGAVLALLLRPRRVIPEGIENVFTLAWVVMLFQVSEAFMPESGLTVVVAAGMAVTNIGTRVTPALAEFKEQLTVLFIGLLFVLLAADVRIEHVQALGWPALGTVAALMFVVRPVQAWLCTIGTRLTLRERAFIAYLAPRGIVAAAVASLFAQTIANRGLQGGDDLRALVFMVIAVTVTVQGLTGGFVARLLGLRRPTAQGYAILGANALARALARLLAEEQPEIVLIDSNPERAAAAERDGFRVVHGQGLHPAVIARAEPESRLSCIAITPNEEVNLLWANKIRSETRAPTVFVTLRPEPRSVPAEIVHEAGAQVLFGRGQDVDKWAGRIVKGEVLIERWRFVRPPQEGPGIEALEDERDALLILTIRRPGRVRPREESALRELDEADVAIYEPQRSPAAAWLRGRGWVPVEPAPAAR